jgi:succinate dehydrogenase/fumarate reductase flavoprotein subunit
MSQRSTNVRRRKILLGAGALVASGVPAAAKGRMTSPHWDYDCDVLCVGSGAAGATAAVIAAAEGAKVIMIEKMPILGGTTAKSSGLAWIFNNFAMRSQGMSDPKEDALKYVVRMGFPTEYDPSSPTLGLDELRYRVVEAFYDNGATAIDHLHDLGVIDFKQFRLFNYDRIPADYADHLLENKAPTGRALDPAVGAGQMGGGHSLTAQLAVYLKKREMPVLIGTRATRIMKDADGRVIGLEAEQKGKPILIRARRGVVFGTGGYAHNTELCNLHQPPIYGTCSLPGSTGDFMNLAQEAGVRMGNLSFGWRGQFVLGEALVNRAVAWGVFMPPGDSMILVNR